MLGRVKAENVDGAAIASLYATLAVAEHLEQITEMLGELLDKVDKIAGGE